jgi:DNA-binding transcriptional regulator of glucitol operon
MSGVTARSRWRFVISPRWLAWHAFTVLAVAGMLWLGAWQFHRAESGNALSWAYTFEWPVFAVFGIVFWAKTMLDEAKPKQAAAAGGKAGATGLPVTAGQRAAGGGEDENDPELDEYNDYLARLHKQVRGHGRAHGLR